MNKRKYVGIVILLISMIMCSMTVSAASNSKNKKAIRAYKQLLKRGEYKYWSNGYAHTLDFDGFILLDINRDGVKELITVGKWRDISVFSYQNNRIVLLGEWLERTWRWDKKGDYIEYNPSQKGLCIVSHGGTGLAGYDMWKIKKGKLRSTFAIRSSTRSDIQGRVETYCNYRKGNGDFKSISCNQYKKYLRQYFSGNKIRKYHVYKNTERNRKKRLK